MLHEPHPKGVEGSGASSGRRRCAFLDEATVQPREPVSKQKRCGALD